ncbi:hypothetical protein T492DRAFT_919929 [Pavlovales sp. CCMP2436]|nr:hypothetical protein T492DRAFT_919929 [Pavlovales sp. CCMP2436]
MRFTAAPFSSLSARKEEFVLPEKKQKEHDKMIAEANQLAARASFDDNSKHVADAENLRAQAKKLIDKAFSHFKQERYGRA